MLSLDRTRIIVDSKIVENLEECVIFFDFKNKINKIALKITGAEKPTLAEVLGFEVVLENNLIKNKETITWTQIICSSVQQ